MGPVAPSPPNQSRRGSASFAAVVATLPSDGCSRGDLATDRIRSLVRWSLGLCDAPERRAYTSSAAPSWHRWRPVVGRLADALLLLDRRRGDGAWSVRLDNDSECGREGGG